MTGEPNELSALFDETLDTGRRMFRENRMEALRELMDTAVQVWPKEAEFQRLAAVAEGTLGNHDGARNHLLNIIALGQATEIDIANYVTSKLALGEVREALRTLERFYKRMGHAGRTILLRSLVEGIRVGAIKISDLPAGLRKMLANIHVLPGRG